MSIVYLQINHEKKHSITHNAVEMVGGTCLAATCAVVGNKLINMGFPVNLIGYAVIVVGAFGTKVAVSKPIETG